MNNQLLADAISLLDEDIINNYFDYKILLKEKSKKHKKAFTAKKWVATAACLAIVATISVWLFVPIETGTQAAKFYTFQIDGLYVQYEEVTELSRFKRFTLGCKIGELYYEQDGNKYYKLKSSDSLEYLILLKSDDEQRLIRFNQFFDDEENKEITLEYVLNTVYNISSAKDIKQISFEKADNRKKETIEKKVKIDKVSVKDTKSIEKILAILYSLKYSGQSGVPTVISYDKDYLDGKLPLSAQTERKVILTLKNGGKLEFIFYPIDNCVSMNGAVMYKGMSEADLEWLIDTVGIDMEYRDYGVPKNFYGETASPPSAP